MSLVLEADSFTHILRIMSTNVDGKRKVRPSPSHTFAFCTVILLPFVANAFSKAAAAPLHPHPMQVPFALTAIRGLGRRFTTLACKKAGVNVHKRYSKRATCHALHAPGGSGMECLPCLIFFFALMFQLLNCFAVPVSSSPPKSTRCSTLSPSLRTTRSLLLL